jgi:heme exporter protein D
VNVIIPLVVIAILALVVLLVSAPLRREAAETEAKREDARLADLRDAKDAKYREIREAELEYRTGHLSEADWRLVDRQLRAEAIAILREIDQLGHPAARDGERAPEQGADRSGT